MSEFLSIYKWAIAASAMMAPALALVGCHLAARDKAMQTLCIGQGASFGVLVGLGLLKMLDASEDLQHFAPFVFAAAFSIGTYYFGERLVSRRGASRNTFYTAIFGSLLALSSLICSIFPPLENHMTQVFFGDLATLSDKEAWVTLLLAIVVLFVMVNSWRKLSKQSFLIAIFGEKVARRQSRIFQIAVNFFFLLVVAFSVQFLGFLFTVALLFLPTVIVSGLPLRSLLKHYGVVVVLASLSTVSGFLISLYFSRLPTVPTIVFLLIVGAGSSFFLGERHLHTKNTAA